MAGICVSRNVPVALLATSPDSRLTTDNLTAHQVIQYPITPITAHLTGCSPCSLAVKKNQISIAIPDNLANSNIFPPQFNYYDYMNIPDAARI